MTRPGRRIRTRSWPSGFDSNISGAAGTLDEFVGGNSIRGRAASTASCPRRNGSNAGSIDANNGGSFAGATILAQGGAPEAEGGTLQILDPILAQHDPTGSTNDVVSEDMLAASGIETLIAIGSVTSQGNATIQLGDGFFLEGRPELDFIQGGASSGTSNSQIQIFNGNTNTDLDVPRISTTGNLVIDAPDISIDSAFDVINNPAQGTLGTGSVTLNAEDIEITGAVIFDKSVANATLAASDDISFTGVPTWQSTLIGGVSNPPSFTLNGALAANGNLALIAARSFQPPGAPIPSPRPPPTAPSASGGVATCCPRCPCRRVAISGPGGEHRAGRRHPRALRQPDPGRRHGGHQGRGEQPGAVRAGDAEFHLHGGQRDQRLGRRARHPLRYHHRPDQWFFTPTDQNPLTGPPAKIMTFNGSNIEIDQGATLDHLSGGGDVFAYEFIPGPGGTRDVLNQLNTAVSGTNGFQYPDGRQVYAIVPGLSNSPAAPFDPIYSANYSTLSTAPPRPGCGSISRAATAWPPAGTRCCRRNMPCCRRHARGRGDRASNVVPGASNVLPDGSLLVSGTFGNAFSGAQSSATVQFSIESQAQIFADSQIALTSGTTLTTQTAQAANLTSLPPVGADAGRLVLAALSTLVVDAPALTMPAPGGRGAEVDVEGTNIDILSSLDDAPSDGAIHVTATSLDNLNADSLLIGGTRTDNTDGTTTSTSPPSTFWSPMTPPTRWRRRISCWRWTIPPPIRSPRA